MTEEWRDIPGYEGAYQVSSLGRVRKISILKTDGGGHKYQRVNIEGRTQYVHRLVAKAFLGEPPEGNAVVNHKDFDSRNNAADNLEWTTQKGNCQYSARNMRGEKAGKMSNTGEVHITKTEKDYVVKITRLKVYRRFKTIEEAVKFRDEVMKNED